MTAYDESNVFARILRDELPSHRVYEDEATVAIMDVMPRVEGHVLVIPRAPSRNILDIGDDDLVAAMRTVKKVAAAVKEALGADGVTIQQFNEPAGGQVIFHTHFHVLPRMEGIPLGPHTGEMADQAVLAGHAETIRRALGIA